jgi:hypothetical protein
MVNDTCKPAFLLFALLFPVLAIGQVAPDFALNVQMENWVFYLDHTGDPATYGTVQGITPVPAGTQFAFRKYLIVADVVSVDGKPATGTFLAHGIAVNPSNALQPVPGRPIVDFSRNQAHQFVLEVLTPDRVQVGSLVGFWLGAGGSAPGAPAGAGVATVTGGSGAYSGVRGQGANVGASNLRTASMLEDPAYRRVNGGGRLMLGFNLSGASMPEVTAIYHADFTPVSASRPARSGDALVLQVRADWPARPSLEPGKAFSMEPLQSVATPVDVLVNDVPAEVVNRVGWPGTRDLYRVDVRLPSVAPGMATVQVDGAYIRGLPVNIPVQ